MNKTCKIHSLAVVAALAITQSPGIAQSLKVENPAPLKSGINRAVADSFVGDHFWSFTAQPGHFRLVFKCGSPEEGFAVGGKATVGAVFAPKTPGSNLTFQEGKSETTFEGSVKQPTRVVVMVEPRKSPLVRQTTDYTLEVTGDVGAGSGTAGVATISGQAESTPSVVGVYSVKVNDFGSAKFQADGSILCTSGDKGSWELFDAGTRTYVITLGNAKYSLTFQPGRGFIDDKNQNLLFEAKPVR